MISEIDIRDWERSISAARNATLRLGKNEDDKEHHCETYIYHFIDKVEALITMNQKQIPALFKPIIKEGND